MSQNHSLEIHEDQCLYIFDWGGRGKWHQHCGFAQHESHIGTS